MGVYNNNKDGTRSTIANTIQVIDAPMEQFVSRDEFSAVVPSDTSADNKLVNDDKFDTNLNNVWKVQGELGAKNLIVYPYKESDKTLNGVEYTINDDGSVTVNGTSTAYSYLTLIQEENFLPHGEYIISGIPLDVPSASVSISVGVTDKTTYVFNSKVRVDKSRLNAKFTIDDTWDNKYFTIRITVDIANLTFNNIVFYPMIRYASDIDDTWQPYIPTNKQLYDMYMAQLPIIGEYLPISRDNPNKKRIVEIGATNCQFNITAFVEKYGITSSSELSFDVLAETSNGSIVAYNRVAVNWSSKAVYIYFDALTEQTTFMCKCSKIQ